MTDSAMLLGVFNRIKVYQKRITIKVYKMQR